MFRESRKSEHANGKQKDARPPLREFDVQRSLIGSIRGSPLG